MVNHQTVNPRLLKEVSTNGAGWTGSDNQYIYMLHLFFV